MPLMLSLLAVTASCVPVARPAQSDVAIVRSFFAGINGNDQAALGALVKPGSRYISKANQIDFDLAETLGMLGPNGAQLRLLEAKPGETKGEIVVRTQIGSEPEQTGVLTLEGGCVTSLVQP